jgi:Tfp pilus assembly ATPase PilU
MKGGSESGAVALFRPTLISLLKAFLSRIILDCLPEAFMAIGQRLLVFCLGEDRMPVADILIAPDAFMKGIRSTDVAGPAPITYRVKEQRIQILGQPLHYLFNLGTYPL